MNTKPILFNTDMVRALLDGHKTMTRRIVKMYNHSHDFHGLKTSLGYSASEGFVWAGFGNPEDPHYWKCPHGQPGDLLWVRETWGTHKLSGSLSPSSLLKNTVIYYAATYNEQRKEQIAIDGADPDIQKWRPSIHMPRWASRLTLRIINVGVERLQDISAHDAEWEGVHREWDGTAYWYKNYGRGGPGNFKRDPIASFTSLWDSIAKPDNRWAENPWMWIIEFEVIKQNVDDVIV